MVRMCGECAPVVGLNACLPIGHPRSFLLIGCAVGRQEGGPGLMCPYALTAAWRGVCRCEMAGGGRAVEGGGTKPYPLPASRRAGYPAIADGLEVGRLPARLRRGSHSERGGVVPKATPFLLTRRPDGVTFCNIETSTACQSL